MEYTIEHFVDLLIEEKGIDGVSDEVMEQIRTDLIERVETMINAEILAHMPESALGDFEKLLDEGTEEEIQEFSKAHIPNLEEVMAATLMKFKAIYLRPITE